MDQLNEYHDDSSNHSVLSTSSQDPLRSSNRRNAGKKTPFILLHFTTENKILKIENKISQLSSIIPNEEDRVVGKVLNIKWSDGETYKATVLVVSVDEAEITRAEKAFLKENEPRPMPSDVNPPATAATPTGTPAASATSTPVTTTPAVPPKPGGGTVTQRKTNGSVKKRTPKQVPAKDPNNAAAYVRHPESEAPRPPPRQVNGEVRVPPQPTPPPTPQPTPEVPIRPATVPPHRREQQERHRMVELVECSGVRVRLSFRNGVYAKAVEDVQQRRETEQRKLNKESTRRRLLGPEQVPERQRPKLSAKYTPNYRAAYLLFQEILGDKIVHYCLGKKPAVEKLPSNIEIAILDFLSRASDGPCSARVVHEAFNAAKKSALAKSDYKEKKKRFSANHTPKKRHIHPGPKPAENSETPPISSPAGPSGENQDPTASSSHTHQTPSLHQPFHQDRGPLLPSTGFGTYNSMSTQQEAMSGVLPRPVSSSFPLLNTLNSNHTLTSGTYEADTLNQSQTTPKPVTPSYSSPGIPDYSAMAAKTSLYKPYATFPPQGSNPTLGPGAPSNGSMLNTDTAPSSRNWYFT